MNNNPLPSTVMEFILFTNPIISPYLADGNASFIERWFNLHIFALSAFGASNGDMICVNPSKIHHPKESLSEEDSSSGENSSEDNKGGSDYKVEIEVIQCSTTSTCRQSLMCVSQNDKTISTPMKGKAKEETL